MRPFSLDPDRSLQSRLEDYWQEVARIAAAVDILALKRAADELLSCQARERVVFAIGNGGSAATASHFTCDLAKGTRRGGPPTFRTLALTDNVPVMTAWANDYSFERVFAEQLVSLAQPGDVLVAISVSGTSPNIVSAVKEARALGLSVISLTGRTGGKLVGMSDVTVTVPSDSMEVVEDAHLIVSHSLCVATREHLAMPVPGNVIAPAQLAS
ncbi:MAG: SIS domain-containing protein [Chloroflexota bacterium]|nr:SIS domain-containing protein [Chloroflexota bacterium]